MKFGVIYADPPWAYNNRPGRSDGRYGDIDHHYPTMAVEEICSLNPPVAPNCVLFLWGTAPLLPEALRVMESWGFAYRSGMVWDKQEPKIGYWFRGQHEHLLVGVRGKVSPPPPHLRTSSVYSEPRGRHSKKPDEIRKRIAAWYPDVPKLEMFCRYPAPGWHVWGNQVDSTLADLPADKYVPGDGNQGSLFGDAA